MMRYEIINRRAQRFAEDHGLIISSYFSLRSICPVEFKFLCPTTKVYKTISYNIDCFRDEYNFPYLFVMHIKKTDIQNQQLFWLSQCARVDLKIINSWVNPSLCACLFSRRDRPIKIKRLDVFTAQGKEA